MKKQTMGKRLKAWRKSRGLTLDQMVEYAGVTQGCLSEYENDKSKPSADTLVNLTEHMNVGWLLTGKGEQGPDNPPIQFD